MIKIFLADFSKLSFKKHMNKWSEMYFHGEKNDLVKAFLSDNFNWTPKKKNMPQIFLSVAFVENNKVKMNGEFVLTFVRMFLCIS